LRKEIADNIQTIESKIWGAHLRKEIGQQHLHNQENYATFQLCNQFVAFL